MNMEPYDKNLEISNILSNLRESPLFVSIFQIASIWVVSDLGYQIVSRIFNDGLSYTNNPLFITFYYLFWITITLFAFWNVYINWHIVKNKFTVYAATLLIIGFIATYIIYLMPIFPSINWVTEWKPPAELVFANGWYFLPKSTEIILQQLLISAMVLSFDNAKFKLKSIRLWCAGLFGSAHLLLVFGGPSLLYVSVFTICATIAGFIFPYLILKVRNGFMYSYILHWSFYAIIILIAHTFFKL